MIVICDRNMFKVEGTDKLDHFLPYGQASSPTCKYYIMLKTLAKDKHSTFFVQSTSCKEKTLNIADTWGQYYKTFLSVIYGFLL